MTHAVSARLPKSDNEIDDINDYIATLSQEERDGLVVSAAALDLALALDRARARQEPTVGDADPATDLGALALDAIEQVGVAQPLTAFRRYLRVLGYDVDLSIVDVDTGESMIRIVLPPVDDAT